MISHKSDRAKKVDIALNNLKMIPWIEVGLAVALTLILVILHFVILRYSGSLWRDEICIVNLSNLPSITQFWEMLPSDSYPVLWYSLLKVWTLIGWNNLARFSESYTLANNCEFY